MAPLFFRFSQIAVPPTPPKITAEKTEHARRFLQDDYDLEIVQSNHSSPSRPNANLDTPPQSSPHQSDSVTSKLAKEVKFIAQPLPDDQTPTLRRLPSSKTQKCSKSILKPTTLSPNRNLEAVPRVVPFPEMLQSVVQQLAGSDMTSRHDGYRTLMTGLEVHEELPDRKALRDKLPLLESFITRDIRAREVDATSRKLALSGIKLAIILLNTLPAGAFDTSFLTFLSEFVMDMIKQEHPAKELAILSMQILSQPHTYFRNTSPERLQELLLILETITDRIVGTNVCRVRCMIYRRLVHQASSVMIEKTSQWLPHLFHAMLSNDSDLRLRAIDAATSAGATIGTSKAFSQAVSNLLLQESSDNIKYLDHFENRLKKLLQKSEDPQSIPRIWGAVMSLLRGSPSLVEKWLCNQGWLKILEKCFNSSNAKLTLEALLAWDKTIASFNTTLSTKVHAIKTLRAPIIGLLQRPMQTKIRPHVLSTYCTLLYYAFAPGITAENTITCWKLLVHDISHQFLLKQPKEVDTLSKIVSALLFDSEVKIWNQKRGMDTLKAPLRLAEVPRLDTAWVRKNVVNVCQVVAPLLCAIQESKPLIESQHIRIWSSLVSALSEAGMKEVMMSTDAKKAYAELMNTLYRIRHGASTGKGKADAALLALLAEEIITNLTAVHFSDSILLRTESGTFEAMLTTPSRHGQAHTRRSQSPLAAFIALVVDMDAPSEVSDGMESRLAKFLQDALRPKTNPKLRLASLGECTQVFLRQQYSPQVHSVENRLPSVNQALLHSLLKLTISSIKEITPSSKEHHRAGVEISNMLTVLRATMRVSDDRILELGRALYGEIRAYAEAAAGHGAVLIALIEPLLQETNFHTSEHSLRAVLSLLRCILDSGISVVSQKTLEHARKALWDQSPATHDPTGLKWLEMLYTSCGTTLARAYKQLNEREGAEVVDFISTTANLLRVASQTSRRTIPGPEIFLWHVGTELVPWAVDVDGKLFSSHSAPAPRGLANAIKVLWSNVMTLISNLSLKSNIQLRGLETLLVAGFRSRSKVIVNSTITTWNNTFGAEDALEYPQTLVRVLRRLQPFADVKLPTFPAEDLNDQELTDEDILFSVDDKTFFPWLTVEADSQLAAQPLPSSSKFASSAAHPLSVGLRAPTPVSSKAMPKPTGTSGKGASKQNTPARMRHQDSQINFVAVGSSPTDPREAESQMLTERQKEVRDRQEMENALFRNIRSSTSPTTPPRRRGLSFAPEKSPKNGGEGAENVDLDHEGIGSDEELPPIVDSSPIERARMGRNPRSPRVRLSPGHLVQHIIAEDENIPSSPPAVQDEMPIATEDVLQYPTSPTTNKEEVVTQMASAAQEDAVDGLDNISRSRGIAPVQAPMETDAVDDDFAEVPLISSAAPDNTVMPELDAGADEAPEERPAEAVDEEEDELSRSQSVAVAPAIPNSVEEESQHDDQLDQTDIVIQDSIVADEPVTNHVREVMSPGKLVTDSGEAPEPAKDEEDGDLDNLTTSQRMVATFVTVPSRAPAQAYEDYSQRSPSQSDSSRDGPQTLRMRKRKASEATPGPTKKLRSSASQESIITVRQPSANSPSLEELAIQSSLFVDPSKAGRGSQKPSSSANSRKRSSSFFTQDEESRGDGDSDATPVPQERQGRKRGRATPPSQSSQQSSFVEKFQSPQKRTRKARVASPSVRGTPTMRLRSAKHVSSPLASTNTSFADADELSADQEVAHTPAVGTKQVVNSSPWDDPTVDITATSVPATDLPGTSAAANAPITRVEAPARAEAGDSTPKAILATMAQELIIISDSTSAPTNSIVAQPPAPTSSLNITPSPATTEAPQTPLSTRTHTHTNAQAPTTTSPATQIQVQTSFPAEPTTAAAPLTSTSTAGAAPPEPLSPISYLSGVLGRLRGILADCTKLVLGPSEGEEMQELAHELQGEIMRARKRRRVE